MGREKRIVFPIAHQFPREKKKSNEGKWESKWVWSVPIITESTIKQEMERKKVRCGLVAQTVPRCFSIIQCPHIGRNTHILSFVYF